MEVDESAHKASLMSTLHNLFSTATTVRKLMGWRRSEDEVRWAEKAVETLVKKLKKKRGALEDLQHAVSNPGAPSRCITIPRSLDGRLQISHRKGMPHVIYCKLWRWADLRSHHELRSLECCLFPFHAKHDEICVNPYHYRRIEAPQLPDIYVPKHHDHREQQEQEDLQYLLQDSFSKCSMPKNVTLPYPPEAATPGTYDDILSYLHESAQSYEPVSAKTQSQQQSYEPVPANTQSQQQLYEPVPANTQSQQQLYEPVPANTQSQQQLYEPQSSDTQSQQQLYGPLSADTQSQQQLYEPAVSADRQSQQQLYEPLSADTQSQQQLYEPLSADTQSQQQLYEPLSADTQSQQQLYEPVSTNAQSQQQLYEPVSANTQSQQQLYEPLTADTQSQQQLYEPLTADTQSQQQAYTQNTDYVPDRSEAIPYREMCCWATIAYYELNSRVGEPFQCRQSMVSVDGYTSPIHDGDRFCLGKLSNVNRNSVIENVRQHIGQGIMLHYAGGELFVECTSARAIFVQSRICNHQNRYNPTDVVKVHPGMTLKIFDTKLFSDILNRVVHNGFIAVYELIKMCTIRMSFVKGWGADYHREDVTATPCWIEITLNGPLKWLDNVLVGMGGPPNAISSVS